MAENITVTCSTVEVSVPTPQQEGIPKAPVVVLLVKPIVIHVQLVLRKEQVCVLIVSTEQRMGVYCVGPHFFCKHFVGYFSRQIINRSLRNYTNTTFGWNKYEISQEQSLRGIDLPLDIVILTMHIVEDFSVGVCLRGHFWN